MLGVLGWMKSALCNMEDVLSVKLLSGLNLRTVDFHDDVELTKSVLELGMSENMAFKMGRISVTIEFLCLFTGEVALFLFSCHSFHYFSLKR